MKLRELNGAIRRVEGPVKLELATGAGLIMTVGLVKSMLMDAVKAAHGGDGQAETELLIDAEGYLRHTHEGARTVAQGVHREVVEREQIAGTEPDTIDIEDLLGGAEPAEPVADEIEDLLS